MHGNFSDEFYDDGPQEVIEFLRQYPGLSDFTTGYAMGYGFYGRVKVGELILNGKLPLTEQGSGLKSVVKTGKITLVFSGGFVVTRVKKDGYLRLIVGYPLFWRDEPLVEAVTAFMGCRPTFKYFGDKHDDRKCRVYVWSQDPSEIEEHRHEECFEVLG